MNVKTENMGRCPILWITRNIALSSPKLLMCANIKSEILRNKRYAYFLLEFIKITLKQTK